MVNQRLPQTDEYAPSFHEIINLTTETDIVAELERQRIDFVQTLQPTSVAQASAVTPPYTWNIKQVVGHLIDGEKVFGYRLHRIACGDQTPMASFDHGPYVDNLDYSEIKLTDLLEEFSDVRSANVRFMQRLPEGAFDRIGFVGDDRFSARAKAYILAGHVTHHFRIIKKRLGLTD